MKLVEILKDALAIRNESVSHVVHNSKKYLLDAKAVCLGRVVRVRVLNELTNKVVGKPYLEALLALRQEKEERLGHVIRFIAPADEPLHLARNRTMHILLMHRFGASLKRFRKVQSQKRTIKEQLGQCERLNYFLMEEQRFTEQYLDGKEGWDEQRFRAKDHLSAKKGFIRSQYTEDQGAFVQAEFLHQALGLGLDSCATLLRKYHERLRELTEEEKHRAAGLIQSIVRLREQKKVVWRFTEKWVQRMKKVRAAKERYVHRSHMLAEDRRARRVMAENNAASKIQRAFRTYLDRFADYLAEKRGEVRSIRDVQREQTFKATMRKQLRQDRELMNWVCPHCARIGVRASRKPFKSWKEVEDHLAHHDILRLKRLELEQERAETRHMKAAREREFIKSLRERSTITTSAITVEQGVTEKIMLALVRRPVVESNSIDVGAAERDEERPHAISLSFLRALTTNRVTKIKKREKCDEQVVKPYLLLLEGENRIGRRSKKSESRHVLDSCRFPKLVSKLHLTISVHDLDAVLVDHRSTNGTQLNGRAVFPESPIQIKVGDEIVIGSLASKLNGEESELAYVVCLVKDDTI